MTKKEICEKLEEIDLYTLCRKFARANGWEYHSGACKECFLINGFPYAIKFVFPTEDEWDEAAQEAMIYEAAKKQGIERIFLFTTLFYVNQAGIKFYIQEKIDTSSCGLSYEAKARLKEKANKKNNKLKVREILHEMKSPPRDDLWTARAYQIYGKKFMQKFAELTNTYGINDLHQGNTGYLNNRPVLLDFAGYHRESFDKYYSS